MARASVGDNGRFLSVHPHVFRAAIALAAIMVLGAVILLGHDRQMDYVLGVVGIFTLVAVSIPLVLARLARARGVRMPLLRWRKGEMEIFTGRMRGWEAGLLILIAPLATSLGLIALLLIADLASNGVL